MNVALILAPLIELENLSTEELQKLTNLAFIRFYMRLRQIWRMLRSITSIGELKAYIRGAFGLGRQMLRWRRASS